MAEYIELEVAVKAFNNFDAGRADSPPCTLLTPEEFAEYLYELPTADVAPVVHGRWIEDHDYLKCPECGVMVKWDFTFFDIGNWNYCPNCGAKMDIEDGGDSDAAD